MALTQDGRPLKITTPLGEGKLFVTGITGQEFVSQLFFFRVELVAPNDEAIDFGALLGQSITIEVVSPTLDGSGPSRYFNGICSRMGQGARGTNFTKYWMDLVPRAWFTSRISTSRIFHQMTVKDILGAINETNGIWDDATGLRADYKKRDYCVQYRETDLNFASRMMEEEGIFYFFKHTNGDHSLYAGDSNAAFPPLDGESAIQFSQSEGAAPAAGVINSWSKIQEVRSSRYSLRDYHFEKPDDSFEAYKSGPATVSVGEANHKLAISPPPRVGQLYLYDFPGEYAQRFDGIAPSGSEQASEIANISTEKNRVAALRIEEELSESVQIRGSSSVQAFQAGRKFTLEGHDDADGEYILTSVKHEARLLGGFDMQSGGGLVYSNTFTCIPAALTYRPKRVTPKPVIHGTQSAVVVGPSGTEIYTDKYGRVRVHFHWDLSATTDVNSSCWVRVGTPWAGNQWGMIHIPRVGHEVIVAFEEGDPDQPVIVSSVYNSANMPPYTLPDNRTQSGIKSRSSLQGTTEMFNELRFEDKKDSEQIYFHAQKDFHRVVENDDKLEVGNDQTIEIKNHRTETVKEGDETITIEKGKRLVTVKQGDDEHLIETGNRILTVETGNDTHTVKTGNRVVTVETGNDTHTVKTGNREVSVDTGNDTHTIKLGNQTTKCNVGKITIEAMQGIDLVVGSSKISITQQGIEITGLMVTTNGTTQNNVKGLMVNVSGSAMLQAKGAITMIG
ncbi:MAG: type VI secretion system tip protein TssI/VgrG [Isosphaeraceae bacterium]|nr:type VI secretion system tip protein TssI/VgrG [Isosphaeraceae bacterium]